MPPFREPTQQLEGRSENVSKSKTPGSGSLSNNLRGNLKHCSGDGIALMECVFPLCSTYYMYCTACADPGGQGARIPLENGFLAILVRIPWKTTKLSSQHSLLGR